MVKVRCNIVFTVNIHVFLPIQEISKTTKYAAIRKVPETKGP